MFKAYGYLSKLFEKILHSLLKFNKNQPSDPTPTSQFAYEYVITIRQIKIKSSLYSPYYAEACNEWRGPSPRLSAWATQLRKNVATVASRWRHCVNLTGPGIEPQTSRTDSVRLATELTGRYYNSLFG